MAEAKAINCRNIISAFYKHWAYLLSEVNDEKKASRFTANKRRIRELTNAARRFEPAYKSARQWGYENGGVAPESLDALIEKFGQLKSKPYVTGSDKLAKLIAPARGALEELDNAGRNLDLLRFMWQHYPAETRELKFNAPPPVEAKPREIPIGTSSVSSTIRAKVVRRRRKSKVLRIPKLGPKQYDALVAAYKMKAFDAESREKIEAVARVALGKEADANNLKGEISRMKPKKLFDSQTGFGGGIWLTERGKKLAELLIANRSSETVRTV